MGPATSPTAKLVAPSYPGMQVVALKNRALLMIAAKRAKKLVEVRIARHDDGSATACAFNVTVELSLDEAREFASALRDVIVNGCPV